MSLVEDVARVLAIADGKDPDDPAWISFPGGEKCGSCWRDQYASKAKASIEATLTGLRVADLHEALAALVQTKDDYDAYIKGGVMAAAVLDSKAMRDRGNAAFDRARQLVSELDQALLELREQSL